MIISRISEALANFQVVWLTGEEFLAKAGQPKLDSQKLIYSDDNREC